MLRPRETRKPDFFYLEYFPNWGRGAEFPDTIAYLTRARGGQVLKIHSPGELKSAVQKMLMQIKPAGAESNPTSWPARPTPKS